MKRTMFTIGGIAIVAVTTACLGTTPIARTNPPSQPTALSSSAPTPAFTASAAASPIALPFGEQHLTPGATYRGTYRGFGYSFAASAPGWVAAVKDDAIIAIKDAEEFAGLIIFGNGYGQPSLLYTDACHWEGNRLVPGPSVDEFANALNAVEGFESSAPSYVTVDGYGGKRLRLKVPDDANLDQCENGEYRGIDGWYNIGAGQTHDVTILDVDGTRIIYFTVFDSNVPDATQEELTRLGNSLQIEPSAT